MSTVPAHKIVTSLNTTLALIGVSTVLILMVGFMGSSYVMEQNAIRQNLTSSANEIASRLALSLIRPMWNYEYQTAQLSLEVEARSSDISWIILRDEEQTIRAGILNAGDKPKLTDPGQIKQASAAETPFFVVTDPLVFGTLPIGTIEVAVNDRQRQQDFLSRIISIMLTQLAISLITMVAIVICVRLLIIRRLAQLQQVVTTFGEKGFATRIPESRPDEIGQLARQFNAMAETIHVYSTDLENQVKERTAQLVESEKLAFLGSLVAGIAHEINTPVGVCLTAITWLENRIAEVRRQYRDSLLTKGGFDAFIDELERSTQMVITNLNRTSELVRTFRGIGADQLKDDYRVFNLGDYLREVIFSLSPKLRKSSHKVEVKCPDEIVIKSYPSAFYQIISNMVVNSLVHGFENKQDGRILIEVHDEQDHLVIRYSDDGGGIATDALPLIFNPFYTTKRGQGGTGLGLYISYTLINKLHGSIACQSQPGKGVLFTIKLPAEIVQAS